ncbi:MAG TPA: GlsB/YeaQ/YmgE family stress response membrane protein [Flavipsychrobacter sp.]|nr:GlsB/YeaQ/YmgE family stress response membrane protein [Flavipsychrobacter sp.]
MHHILLFLFIGAVAGWLACLIIRGRGFGLLANIIVGIIGGWIGGELFGNKLNVTSSPTLNEIFCATLGAIILVGLLRLIRGR